MRSPRHLINRAMNQLQLLQIVLLLIANFLASSAFATCAIVSVSGGNFGTVTTQNNVGSYHLADVTVSCDSTYSVGLDAGSHYLGSRQLAHTGGATIPYTLFQGASASEWGSQSLAAINTYPMPAFAGTIGTNIIYSIYATALSKDKLPQGSYNDTVTVILADGTGNTISTATINFTLSLVAFCTLDTRGFNSFGRYPVGSARITNVTLGSIAVTCPATVAYKIGIDKGLNLANGMRRMALNNRVFIPYILRYNSSEWGDAGLNAVDSSYTETFAIASAVANTGTGTAQNFMIYGDAWIDGITTIGTYTDTLIVTLVW